MLQYVDGNLGSVNLIARTSTQTWIPLLLCVAFEVVSLLRTHDDHVHPICFNCTIHKDIVQDKNQNPKRTKCLDHCLYLIHFMFTKSMAGVLFCTKKICLYIVPPFVSGNSHWHGSHKGSRQRHGSRRSAQLGIRNVGVAPVNFSWFSYWNVHL